MAKLKKRDNAKPQEVKEIHKDTPQSIAVSKKGKNLENGEPHQEKDKKKIPEGVGDKNDPMDTQK